MRGKTYRLELVKCGKKTCKRCPHGPYWYEYKHSGIYVKKRYVGKELPQHIRAQLSWDQKRRIKRQEVGFEVKAEDAKDD